MFSMLNLVDNWVTRSFPIIQTILIVLIAIFAVVVIVAVMLTPSNSQGGSNAITGTKIDSYYMQNKSQTKEGKLKKLIIASSIIIFVLTIIYFITMAIFNGQA